MAKGEEMPAAELIFVVGVELLALVVELVWLAEEAAIVSFCLLEWNGVTNRIR